MKRDGGIFKNWFKGKKELKWKEKKQTIKINQIINNLKQKKSQNIFLKIKTWKTNKSKQLKNENKQ